MFLSVVIPAFNEEKRLPETLKKVRDYLTASDYEWEVLVVNDGSKDGTATVVSDLIKEWSARPSKPEGRSGGFHIVDNKENKGKGGVVKQGMLEAKGEWRLFMDADGSTDVSEIEKLWAYKENFEIIIGSRYLNKDSIKIKQPLMRQIVSRMGNWLIRIMLGINLEDTQCGFKLFSAKVAEEIFPKQTIMRWGFDMEILAIAKHRGYQIKEVAVDWYDAEGSQVKKFAALKTLKELITIKWNLMRKRYI